MRQRADATSRERPNGFDLPGSPHAIAAAGMSSGTTPSTSKPSASRTSATSNLPVPTMTRKVRPSGTRAVRRVRDEKACASPATSGRSTNNTQCAARKTASCPGASDSNRPQSATTSISSGKSPVTTRASSRSSAPAASALTGPARTSSPPGSRWTWEEGVLLDDSDRRPDRTRLVIPRRGDNPNRAARSPPDGSHSATMTGRFVGQAAPSAHVSVVTPGAPLAEHNATSVMIGGTPRQGRLVRPLTRWRRSAPGPRAPGGRPPLHRFPTSPVPR